MAQRLKNLTITRVALVQAGSNPHADIVLLKKKPALTQPKEPEFMKKIIDVSKLSPEEQATMAALLTKSATDLPDPAPAPVPASAEADIIKSLPAEAQALLKRAQDTADAAVKAAEAATEVAMIEKHAREEGEFVVAATPFMKAYPGATVANTQLVHRIKKAITPADYTALEVLLKAGNAALTATVESGELGSTLSAPAEVDELTVLAKARQTEKGISYSDAYSQILDENPAKVAEVRKAQAKRRRRQDEDND